MNHNIEQGFEFWITIRNPENTEFRKTDPEIISSKCPYSGFRFSGYRGFGTRNPEQ